MRGVSLYILILINISAYAGESSFKIEVSHVIEKDTTIKHINSEQLDYKKTIYLVNELNVKVDSVTIFGISPLFPEQKFFRAFLPNEYKWASVYIKVFKSPYELVLGIPKSSYTYKFAIQPYFKNEAN